LAAIPPRERAIGPGATIAMAAFLHPSPGGGRFNSERLGAWYAACDIGTAIRETLYHHGRRLRASAKGFPNRLQMRELRSSPRATLRDIRGMKSVQPQLYDPDPATYDRSQAFGDEVRRTQVDGIIYDSVRCSNGVNVVLFKPRLVMPLRQADHYEYSWDTLGNASVAKLTNIA
jgi:RES domain-containing protein